MLWIDVVAFVILWGLAFRHEPHNWIWICGLSLGAFSLPFWIVARRQLGSSFTVRAEARQLVTRGLYARLSHPIYIFGGLAYLGVFLALQDRSMLIAYLVFSVVVQGARARRESRVLEARFGQTYRDYRNRTWV
jgi:protein-S-isoprenylcysteine O-methyltransferase Ste14